MSHSSLHELERNLKKAVDHLLDSFSRVRTGRANASLISNLMVESYGSRMPLEQVAKISVEDHATLLVTPWDQNTLDDIEAGIRNSDLGLNPARSGTTVRIPIPPLTGERRALLIKNLGAETEGCRVAVRQHRRDTLQKLKALQRAGEVSEDEVRTWEKQAEQMVKKFIEKIDHSHDQKTREISQV